MRSVGMTGQKWFTCGRCGFDYPVKYRRQQDGLSVCTYLPCFDTKPPSDTPIDELGDIEFILDDTEVADGF